MTVSPDPLGSFDVDWERCHHAHAPALALWVRLKIGRHLSSKADADDLVQEAFLQAFQKRDQFRGATEAEFLAWLRAILASRVEKLARRYRGASGRDVGQERPLPGADLSSQGAADGLAGHDTSPSGRVSRVDLTEVLADALGRLPAGAREVLIQRHFEGLTFPDIARRLGRTPDAVMKTWQRSLPLLREFLGDRV